MSRLCFMMIVAIAIVLVCMIIFGVFGAPWEHIVVLEKASSYLYENYGITATKLTSSFFFNDNVYVHVTVDKEKPYLMTLRTSRKRLGESFIDDYYERLASYKLMLKVNDKVDKLIDDEGWFILSFHETLLSDPQEPPYLTLDDMDNDNLIEKTKGMYKCSITYEDFIGESFDYERDYEVCKVIFDRLFPDEVVFYYENKKADLSICSIDKESWAQIKSVDDFIANIKR